MHAPFTASLHTVTRFSITSTFPSLRWINLQAGRLHTCRLKSWHTGRVSSNWKKMCQILLLRNILLRDRSRTIVTKEKEEGGREREREKKQLSQCLSRQNHSSTVTHLHSRLPFHAQRRAEEDKKPVVIPSSSPHNHTHAFFLKKKKKIPWTLDTFKLTFQC